MTNTIYLLVFLLSLTLSSCGGGEHSATDTGSASFGLKFEEASAPAMKLAPSMAPADICTSYGIDSISGTVYNSSNSVIATGDPWACSAHTGTINNIPPGSNLRIAIKGTVSGTVVWQGETTGATIYAGQDTNVGSIPMTYTGNDTTRPTVSAATPTGTTVPLTSPITVTFSESMAASTIDSISFTLKNGSVAVSGSVAYNATTKTATFTPTSGLSNSVVYTATVTTDVTDMAANKMLSLYTWNFTTEAPPGSVPTAPTGVSATAADKQVTVSWTAVTGATSYNIYWSTTTGVTKTNGTLITGATSPYIHTGLTNGTTYYYVVTAVNSYGESGESVQVSVMPVGVVTAITAEWDGSVFAVKNDGTVYAWGQNFTSSPSKIQYLDNIISIYSGGTTSYGLQSGGVLWAWGDNSSGQIGNGTFSIGWENPAKVINGGISMVAGGGGVLGHAVALRTDGTVMTWGDNSYGQLGNGTTVRNATPQLVSSLSSIVYVSAGIFSSFALKNDGSIWAWGYNYSGQLGDGSTSDRLTPIQLLAPLSIKAISTGGDNRGSQYYGHTLALQNDGTVWGWGDNTYGQLGDGTTINRTSPIQLTALTNVIAISCGGKHSLALKADGTVWAWGINSFGQLGDGTKIDKLNPVQVSALSNVKAIVAGRGYSYALKNDGTLWAWGWNGYGNFGNSTYADSLLPVQIP